ncbi:DNA cytosine methyltransferase [Mycoplasma crocodyli]|uniref:DNA cytosine methyltransferase n=1 Tax=Mycoplasma crocodyli TaxID=50052 RepID=UPI0034E00955
METFTKNFPNSKTLTDDITNSDIKQLIINQSKNLGVNMIIGGLPCQGFSLKEKNLVLMILGIFYF